MERQEHIEIEVDWWPPRPFPIPWECPRCALVTRTVDPALRCRRCGFWETAS